MPFTRNEQNGIVSLVLTLAITPDRNDCSCVRLSYRLISTERGITEADTLDKLPECRYRVGSVDSLRSAIPFVPVEQNVSNDTFRTVV